jgi:hypothetical protein
MNHATSLILAAMLLTGCAYQRIGSLTMVSTRNVSTTTPGTELLRNVEAKARTKHDDALQEAIDLAVQQHPRGEYMMNCAVFVKSNGNYIKVRGDVWGYGPE